MIFILLHWIKQSYSCSAKLQSVVIFYCYMYKPICENHISKSISLSLNIFNGLGLHSHFKQWVTHKPKLNLICAQQTPNSGIFMTKFPKCKRIYHYGDCIASKQYGCLKPVDCIEKMDRGGLLQRSGFKSALKLFITCFSLCSSSQLSCLLSTVLCKWMPKISLYETTTDEHSLPLVCKLHPHL